MTTLSKADGRCEARESWGKQRGCTRGGYKEEASVAG